MPSTCATSSPALSQEMVVYVVDTACSVLRLPVVAKNNFVAGRNFIRTNVETEQADGAQLAFTRILHWI